MTRDELASVWDTDEIASLLPPSSVIQIIGDDGALVPGGQVHPDLTDEDLRELYRLMVVARRVDLEAIRLQRQGQLGLHISSKGQEAAQVGSAYAMEPDDWAFPQGRELPAAITRGLAAADLMHVWRGTALSHHDPYEERFGYFTIPIATQCLHAVGFALGAQLDGDPVAVVCYVGDGGTSEGDFHEALNMAAVWQVPCVFLVQNNQYALSVPAAQQTRAPSFAHKAVGYGMPGLRVDGNDVLASYAVTADALRRARSGGGPTLIEAVTYRQEAHSTSDDPARYRPAGELETWERYDPIRRMGLFLEQRGLLDDDTRTAIGEAAEGRARQLRDDIVDAPTPDPDEIFVHLYEEIPPPLQRQREQLREELRRDA